MNVQIAPPRHSPDTSAVSEADAEVPVFAPKAAYERVAVLDIQRGIAILLIFVVNITGMGNSFLGHIGDPPMKQDLLL